MSRYIDEDVVLEKLYETQLYDSDDYFIFEEILKNTSTADVQEVRHGEWIKSKNERKCSICGYFYFTNTKSFNYCPNCGATMNKDKKRTGMTNFEKIKAMTIEELANLIITIILLYGGKAPTNVKHWLESEAVE